MLNEYSMYYYRTQIRNWPIRSQLYCDKSWYPTISSHWPDIPWYHGHFQVMLSYDKRLQKRFANKQLTRNLRFSWCFAVEKKAPKTFPPKLNWKKLANLNIQTVKLELPNFRWIWILGISKMKLQVKELKRCQKRNFIQVLKTKKVSIQAGQHNLHYVPGKHSCLQRPTRNPLKSTRNKNFPGFWNIFIGRYERQREANSNRPQWKRFNEVLTGIYRKKCRILHHLWRRFRQR